MKLYRYLLANFGKELKQPWENKKSDTDGLIVTFGLRQVVKDCPDSRLITSSIELAQLPDLDVEGRILVPKKEREKCEAIAWHVINLVSVLESCSKQIFSPIGCIAFGSEDQNELDFLKQSSGILAFESKSESAAGWNIEWTIKMANAVSDRFDGVVLLSEALSAGSEGNRYREFVRFLELAFGLSFYDKRLAKKLTQFLSSAPGGYDREEVNEWVKLRHPSTHADFKKTDWIALSADIRHVVLRMHQACLDVLFNKKEWRNRSSSRRQIWIPDAITTSKTGNIVAKKGTALNFQFRVFDEFGLHPVKLDTSIDHSKDDLYATYWQTPN